MTMLPRKRRREKTGCLCCRKRKIKCDNSKPRCKRCIKSSYICEWSDQVSRSVIDYVLKKSSVNSVKFIDFSESKYMRKTIAATSNSQRAADTDKIIDHAKSDNNNGNDITSSHCLKINTNNNQRFCIGNKSNNYTGSLPIQKSRLNRNVVVMNENENNISKKQILEDALFRRYLQQLGKSHVSKCNIGNTQIISTAFETSINEMSLIDSFVNGFMLAVSTVLTHESLQFSSVVIPKVIHHPILRNVFYVCGASYLCWDRKDLQFLAEEQYIICLRALQEFVQKEGIADNEELILTTMIIFCLREKYQCENKIRKDLFLIAAFEIIKYKTKIKMSKNESIVKNDNNQCENDIFKEFDEIELKLKLDEIFDYLFRIEQDSSILEDFQNGLITFSSIPMDNGISDYCITTNLLDTLDSSILSDFQIIGDISAFEKTMFESFLYNYSVNLLTLDSSIVKYMSSPFQVYKILKPILLHSPYNFPVKWMNNPIMGASLPAFELSAKANWFLLHYPLNDSYTKLVKKLRNSAKYYTSPFLPDSVKFNQREELQRKLLESCHVGNMVAKASYILLTKTLYPDYDSSAEDIQEALDVFFENLKKLSDHSQICGMCAWPCAIAGTAINKPYQRDYLEKRINKFCRVKKSKAFWRILSFLKFTWGENSIPGPGWDALLNPSSFKDLFI